MAAYYHCLFHQFLTISHQPEAIPSSKAMSIVAESPDFIQVFSDGSVKRFAPEIASPSAEPTDGYVSKDVTIDESKPVTARLFLPSTEGPTGQHLPVLVYFHGGGFCIGSTTWLGYHHFLGCFSALSRSVVLSVDYRLAPENRLPAAYEDCYDALKWLGDNASSEPWLKMADLSRVFLSGDSAGGNITHQVAITALRDGACSVKIKGLLLIHPYFGSEKRTPNEMVDQESQDLKSNDMFWRLSIPEGSNRDYFGCNFEMQEVLADEWNKFPAVAVYVAGLDFLKERGLRYAEFLVKKGVKDVILEEAEEESHVFHVFNPLSKATRMLQQRMGNFMNSH